MQNTAEMIAKKKAFIEQYRLKMKEEAAAKALIPPPKKLKDIPQIVPFLPDYVELDNSDVNTLRRRGEIYGGKTLYWVTDRFNTLSKKRRIKFLELLLQNGADSNRRVNGVSTGSSDDNETILMDRVYFAGHRTVALLISYNADITVRNFFGNTVLDYAASYPTGQPHQQALQSSDFNWGKLNPNADFSKQKRDVTGLFPLLSKIHTMVFDWNTPPSETLTIIIHQSIGHNNFTLDLARIVAHYAEEQRVKQISSLLEKEIKETPERLDLFRSYCRIAHERYTRSQNAKKAILVDMANAKVSAAATATTSTAVTAASAPRKSTNWSKVRSKVKRIFFN